MPKPPIFISHSAEEPEAHAVVEFLDARLAPHFEIWRDARSIGPGDAWRAIVSRWLAECRAAIVVLSPAALTSSWVNNEAFSLRERHTRQAGGAEAFPLIPLLVAGARQEDLEANEWDAPALNTLQCVAVPPGGIEAAFPAIFERLEPVLELEAADGSRRAVRHKVATDLLVLDGMTVAELAEALEVVLQPWESHEQRILRLTERLLSARLNEQATLLLELGKLKPQLARRVYEHVAPWGWVDEEAAQTLAAVHARPQSRRGASINSEQRRTCDMYVRRVRWDAVLEDAGEGFSEQFTEEIVQRAREVLKASLGFGAEPVDDAEIDAELSDPPVSLLLGALWATPATIGALRERFPALTILVACGQRTPADFAALGLADVEYVLPALDRDVEAGVLQADRTTARRLERYERTSGVG